ncbi:MAG: flagellar motor switch protein FliN [Acidimicrobiales bacterium]
MDDSTGSTESTGGTDSSIATDEPGLDAPETSFGADDAMSENGTDGGPGSGSGSGSGFGEPTMAVDPALYPDLSHAQAAPGEPRDLRLLSDIELELCVEIGRARLPLRQLLALTPGSVVELDRALGEPVDVLVNGTLVGRGQIVTIGDEFGVRLSEIVDPSNGGPPSRRRS